MKQINQLLHFTSNIEILKSILKNGLYTSYGKEIFCGKNQLVPMISFSNILFRDVGENEVVSYGNYGIGISREIGMTKYGLNPVFYVSKDSEIEKSIEYQFNESMIPQAFEVFKQYDIKSKSCCGSFLDNAEISPLSKEVEVIARSINSGTSDDLIESFRTIFGNLFEASMHQILLLKNYRVTDKYGKEFIAYNEREWRKSFFELHFIREFKPNGNKNEEYERWSNTKKPHFTDKYILQIEPKDLEYIIVKEESEKKQIEDYIQQEELNIPLDKIYRLNELREKENNDQ